MPTLRDLASLLSLALLVIWLVGSPGGPVGSALSQARGSVDPRVAERAAFMAVAQRQVSNAVRRSFAALVPLVELHQNGAEMQVLIPHFMFKAPDTSRAVMEALMQSFIDAPGMRLRVHAPRDLGREMRLRLRRLTDKAFWLAAIPPSSLAFTWARDPAAPSGWITFIFTSGMGRYQ
ncbi:hypothetical protein [Limimaricola soesokkakensis]|uniref:hypothetical protein n=1 Tax=Limimaricola soesokkakensis TaxID=1343159 RepID=UPI003516AA5B